MKGRGQLLTNMLTPKITFAKMTHTTTHALTYAIASYISKRNSRSPRVPSLPSIAPLTLSVRDARTRLVEREPTTHPRLGSARQNTARRTAGELASHQRGAIERTVLRERRGREGEVQKSENWEYLLPFGRYSTTKSLAVRRCESMHRES